MPKLSRTAEAAKKAAAGKRTVEISATPIDLGAELSTKPMFQRFHLWLGGTTPLITHAWSFKAKREMLLKQIKATKPGREERDPVADFVSSLYDMGEDPDNPERHLYGFPVTGIKNAILSAAHKDKGIARVGVMHALWLDFEMVRVMPALDKAICDMPLVRVHGAPPEMREDMVKIGAGLNKTANLAYRGQFWPWAFRITGEFNPVVLTANALASLVGDAGRSVGLGEWRNERKGVFGAFRLLPPAETPAWDRFAAGKGPVPLPEDLRMAAE